MRAMWLPKHWGKATLLAGAILLYLATAGTAAEGKPVIKRGWIGVSVQELTPSLRDAMQLGSRTGLLINDVVADSPADEAGLRQEDVLLEFNGEKVERVKRLSSLVRNTEPNTDVEVKIFREGEENSHAHGRSNEASKCQRVLIRQRRQCIYIEKPPHAWRACSRTERRSGALFQGR